MSACRCFSKRLLFFGRNSGVHGLKYVFEEQGTKLSRTVWLLILLIFIGCLYLLLMPVVQRGNAVSFIPDTRYLYWNTTFPAVTICETYSPKSVLKKLSENYGLVEPLNYDYKRYVADLLFGRGICSRSLCLPCGTAVPCDVPWRNIIENIHKQCNEMIVDCHFNGKEFSCCENFHMVDSEYGSCFSFNSLQSKYIEESQFVVNRSTGPGVLTFDILSDAQVTIHSSEELSTNVLDKKFKLDVKTNRENFIDLAFSIIEVDNENVLQYEDIAIRKCRYNYEIPKEALHTYQLYSYGACRLAKSTAKAFDHCGCVHPVRDLSFKNIYCNYTGLNCLVTYEALKTKLGNEDIADATECLPSCIESELSIVHVSNCYTQDFDTSVPQSNGWLIYLKIVTELGKQPSVLRSRCYFNYSIDPKFVEAFSLYNETSILERWVGNKKRGTLVNIRMASLPTMRYQKNLLRTDLDLVVTVGGMVGLFFSASILSFVEIFYLILRSSIK